MLGVGYLMYESGYVGLMWSSQATAHTVPHQEGLTIENVCSGRCVGIQLKRVYSGAQLRRDVTSRKGKEQCLCRTRMVGTCSRWRRESQKRGQHSRPSWPP